MIVNSCMVHNLPEEIICVGYLCQKRLGCQLCIDKHYHKFYLDSKAKQKQLAIVRKVIDAKIQHLSYYTKSNVKALKLDNYRDNIQRIFSYERLFFESKLEEDRINFNVLMDKAKQAINVCFDSSEKAMLEHWKSYSYYSYQYASSEKEYAQLRNHFQTGDWTLQTHVYQSINFLFSEYLLFRFNRNLDSLKRLIHHHKIYNYLIFKWLQTRRYYFKAFYLCPYTTFDKLMTTYKNPPQIGEYQQHHSKYNRDDQYCVLEVINEDRKTLMIYPWMHYDPFQNIYKLIRYSNNVFVTSGGRGINLWTRVSMQPENTYPLDYPSYGLTVFRDRAHEETEMVLFGNSKGELGMINIEKKTVHEMSAHQAAIRDILQIDEHHFLTASQDWLMKIWAVNTDSNNSNFALERQTVKGHSGKIHCLSRFGPNVLAAGADGLIRLWDIMGGIYDYTFPHYKYVYALAYIRPEFFASGGYLKYLRIWDYRKTKCPLIRYPIEHSIHSILRYDNNTIIFNDKNVVKIVDIRYLREPVLRMENGSTYQHTINCMTYLSDAYIGMGGSDGFVTLWKY